MREIKAHVTRPISFLSNRTRGQDLVLPREQAYRYMKSRRAYGKQEPASYVPVAGRSSEISLRNGIALRAWYEENRNGVLETPVTS